MNSRLKGWLFVVIQMFIICITAYSAAFEHRIIDYPVNPFISKLGLVIVALGFIFVFASVISFRQFITPHPEPLQHYKLRRNGMYGIVRHPIYFSIIVIMLGCVLFFTAYFSFIWVLVLIFWFNYKGSYEEGFLMVKFPEYPKYKMKVRKLIPFIY